MSYQPPSDLPPGLFAARPVRSDFARRAPSYAVRRFITVGVILALIGGGLTWKLGSSRTPAEIPTIHAGGPYKERPQQPGGLDVPHQDIEVYAELDKKPPQPPVEHLLPLPELPQITAQALPQAPVVKIQTPPPEPESAPPMPPAPSDVPVMKPAVEVLQPLKNNDDLRGNDILGEKSPRPVMATTVMPLAAKPAPPSATAAPLSLTPHDDKAPPPTPAASSHSIEQILQNIDAIAKPKTPAAAPAAHATPAAGAINMAAQLASLPDQAAAQHTLAQLQKEYATQLNGISLHLVRADLGAKGIYYRIKTPPLAPDRAHALCAALQNLHAGCLLVKP